MQRLRQILRDDCHPNEEAVFWSASLLAIFLIVIASIVI